MFRWFESRIDPVRSVPVQQPPTTLIAFYWHFVRQAWPGFAAIMAVGLVAALVEVSLFAFVGELVDLLETSSAPADFFSEHGWTLIVMAVIAMVARPVLFALHAILLNQTVAPGFNGLIRWQNHRYVLRQSLSFFQNDFAGRISNRVMQTGAALRQSSLQVVDAMWFVSIYTVSAMVLFFENDPTLMIPLVVWIAGFVCVLWYFVPRIRDRAKIQSEARSALSGRIVDSYTNIMTVKQFAHASREETYARQAIADHTAKLTAQMRLITVMEIVIWTLNGGLIAGTAGLALWLWSGGLVSLGAIALACGLVIRINNMSGWIMWVVTGIFEEVGIVQEGMMSISRPLEVVDRPDAKPLEVTRGAISYQDIHFHYGGDGERVIAGLSLDIAPGEKVGIVGRSGAGKSTLISVLQRFYDLEAGRVLIDGQDIAHVTQNSLRAQIGVVSQDTSLLHRSVRDNIRYGRPDADEAMVEAAARQAHADQFIPNLHDLNGRSGMDAHVGERGVKLSGGQRQRIAIARVLLKDAPILILDEATSALDSEVEAAIQEQFHNLMADKTVIAIAHRLSTIAAMDRLVIMDEGQIVEEGTHDQLLRQGGVYAALWARQSGGFLARESAA